MSTPAYTRHARPLTLLAAVAFASACATEKAAPSAEASASAAVAAQADVEAQAKINAVPKLGGSVAAVGDFQAELAVHENGWVKGLVFDAQGIAVTPTRVSDFKVELAAEGDAKLDLTLSWDATCKCFLGNAFDGKADLGAGLVVKPVQMSFNVDGAAQAGALAAYTLLPKLDLSARADLAGNVKVPSPEVKANLSAGVKAKVPTADVTVKPPAAKAGLTAKASGAVSLPKPSVKLDVKQSASTSTAPKAGASAGVKAKAGLSFGTK